VVQALPCLAAAALGVVFLLWVFLFGETHKNGTPLIR
jgi:hypothetical protein